jgi:hypothetical protein
MALLAAACCSIVQMEGRDRPDPSIGVRLAGVSTNVSRKGQNCAGVVQAAWGNGSGRDAVLCRDCYLR